MRVPSLGAAVRIWRGIPASAVLAACLVLALGPLPACQGSEGVPRDRQSQAVQPYNLGRDESLGGHTLSRHVGKTDEALHERLRGNRHIAAASTYSDRATAERVVAETLARGRARLEAWQSRRGSRPNLVLEFRGDRSHPIGRSLRRGDRQARPAWDAVVVLKWHGEAGSFVLTSYPELRR